MARALSTCPAQLAEDTISVPSMHIGQLTTFCNSNPGKSDTLVQSLEALNSHEHKPTHRYMHIHIIKNTAEQKIPTRNRTQSKRKSTDYRKRTAQYMQLWELPQRRALKGKTDLTGSPLGYPVEDHELRLEYFIYKWTMMIPSCHHIQNLIKIFL